MALSMTTSTSEKAGACNCCEDHITVNGMTPHAVAILKAGYGNQTASLRFCEKCFGLLKLLVGVVDPPRMKGC